MTVTSQTTLVLFCEGKPASLDMALLSRLLQPGVTKTQIVPSGGKRGLKSFMQGWILEAAKAIAAYQATRWSLAKLKPGDRWPSIADRRLVSWQGLDEVHAASATEWDFSSSLLRLGREPA